VYEWYVREGLMVGVLGNGHEIATSSRCEQSWTPQPRFLHWPKDDSLPEHRTLSNQIRPLP